MPLPGKKDLEKLDDQNAYEQAWQKIKANACTLNGIGDPKNPLIDAEKPMRFIQNPDLHTQNEVNRWHSLSWCRFGKKPVKEDQVFLTRVLRSPFLSNRSGSHSK